MLLALALAGKAASADEKTVSWPEFGDVPVQTFAGAERLPEKSVTAIALDRHRYLWVGTPSGLFRYDGSMFIRLEPTAGEPMGSLFVRALYAGGADALWVGTELDGVWRVDVTRGQARRTWRGSDARSNSVQSIVEDDTGTLWIGTRSGLFRQLPDGRAERVEVCPASGECSVFALAATGSTLWAGTSAGLHGVSLATGLPRSDQAELQASGLAAEQIRGLRATRSGVLVVGTLNRGAFLFSEGRAPQQVQALQQLSAEGGNPSIWSIAQPTDGELWFAGFGGVVVTSIDGTTIRRHLRPDAARRDALASSIVRTLEVHSDGHVLVGGLGVGLQKVPTKTSGLSVLRAHSRKPWVTSSDVSSILETRSGMLLFGSRENGVDFVDRREGLVGGLRPKAPRPGEPPMGAIGALEETPDQAIWVGLRSGGLLRISPEQLREPEPDHRVVHGSLPIRSLKSTGGQLWIAADSELCVLDLASEQVEEVREARSGERITSVNAFQSSPDGGLWAGSGSGGLYRSRTGRPPIDRVVVRVDGQSIEPRVVGMLLDRRGRLWVDSTDELLMIDDPHASELQAVRAGAALRISDLPLGANLREDDQGRLWTQKYLVDWERRSATLIHALGAPGIGTAWFRSHAATRDGLLLFGGSEGVLVANPAAFPNAPGVRPIQLGSVTLDGRRKLHWPGDPEVVIPANWRSAVLNLYPPNLQDASTFRLRYRLDDDGQSWTELEAGSLALGIGNIGAGSHRIVIASSSGGPEVRLPANLPIRVLAPFWHTPLFLVALGVAVLIGIATAVRYRIRAMTASRAALELAVHERTRSLSEEVQARGEAEFALQQKNRELELARNELESAMQRRNDTLANVTHEFRTPIAIILNAFESLAGTRRSPKEASSLQRGKNAANGLLRLVNQMLTLTKLRSTTPTLEARDIGADLRGLIAAYAGIADEKRIQILWEGPESVSAAVVQGFAETAIGNLLANAIRYSPEDSIVQVALSRLEAMLQIEVRDEGPGIPDELANRLGERFTSDRLTEDGLSGAGLGMAIVFEAVRASGGSIEVRRNSPRGTRVVVGLPMPTASQSEPYGMRVATIATEYDSAEPESEPDPRPIVLAAEDNPDLGQQMREALEGEYRYLGAVDGQEAFDLCCEHVPDIVISDVMMPRMNGFELCRQLKQQTATSHIPVLLLTARGAPADLQAGLESNAIEYLVKPVSMQELRLRLRNLLRLREDWRRWLAAGNDRTLLPSANTAVVQPGEQAFLERFNEVLGARLGDAQLTIADLAAALSISERQLRRKILAMTGKGPADLLRIARLAQARTLLREGQMVKQAALASGFVSMSHFSRCYASHFGVPPSIESSITHN